MSSQGSRIDNWRVSGRASRQAGIIAPERRKNALGEALGRKFTVMLIPHDDRKTFRFQISTFLIGFLTAGIAFVIAGFVYLSSIHTDTEQKRSEKASVLSTTQENLDSILAEVKELMKVYQVFKSSLDRTLKELDIKSNTQSEIFGKTGDLGRLLDVQELSIGEIRELADIKSLSESLSRAVQPLSEIGDVLQAQKQLLSDIPNLWPVTGGRSMVTMEFGPNIHPFTNSWYIHKGLDIAGPIGLPIVASANGRIIETKYDRASGYGLSIMIEHKYGFRTKYTHLNSILVSPGQVVKQGQRIGTMGNTGISTGSHTHFELLLGTQVLDPASFLKIHSNFQRWEGNR
jgi:murein DD-endopeptidase MepM/ murein hydrolase activator NlpD